MIHTPEPKIRQPELIDVSLIDDNPLSANVEDTTTFDRLQKSMEEDGLLEIPVVKKQPNGRFMMIAWKHRKDAFRSLGGTKILAVVIDKPYTPEQEFNDVNNMNLIKGDIKKRTLVKIIKEQNIDPTKLDLLKIPSQLLCPVIDTEDIKTANAEAQRNARLNELTLEIAKIIAPHVLKDRDELITVMLVKDSVAAILRIPFPAKQQAREKAEDIEKRIGEALMLIPTTKEKDAN